MYHSRHQAFFKARVPPLREPWLAPNVQAGGDWTPLQNQQLQSAATLLSSALGWEHPLVALLRNELIFVPEQLPLTAPGNIFPAAYRDGRLFVNPPMVGFLFLMAEAVGHELVHAANHHDRLPEGAGINRIRVRCEWEVVASQGEQEINSSILQYLLGTPGFQAAPCTHWTQELLHYRLNTDLQLAYHRMRLALLDLVQRLTEVAHHDTSVTDPRISQVFVFAQSITDRFVSTHPPLSELSAAFPGMRNTIGGFGIPAYFSQSHAISTALDTASSQCAEAIQINDQVTHLSALWKLRYFE